MSKPDWCPQKIWDVVLGLTPAPPFSGESVVVNNLRVETARAIFTAELTERERAARILEKRIEEIVNEYGDYEPDTNYTNLPEWAETVIEELEASIDVVRGAAK